MADNNRKKGLSPEEKKQKVLILKKLRADYQMIRDDEIRDLQVVLGTPEGLKVLQRIMDWTQLFGEAMTGNSHTYFNLGMQNIGKKLLGEVMNAKPNISLADLKYKKSDERRNLINTINKLDQGEKKR